jgi:anionic cell wall polymer biosynthesis LytR-Cps2A-Psr (LCP) family protein
MARYYTVKTKRRRIKKGRLLFLLALCGFLLTLFLSIRFLGTLNATQDQTAWATALPTPIQDAPEIILFYSVSDKEGGTVTCLVLGAYHADNQTFNAVNIPVETLLDVDNYGFMRLAHTYGAGGRELLLSTVSSLFDLPIHTYLEVNEVFLPTALDLLDTPSILDNLEITNGGGILTIIHANDLTSQEHLEQRRLILTALSAEVLDAGMLAKVRLFLRVSPLVQTNMPWRKFLSFMDTFKTSPYQDTVTLTLLPGKEDVQSDGSYWLPDTEEIPYLAVWLRNPQAKIPTSQIAVEVLNGSGTPGLANDVAKILIDAGYNIIDIGNADHYDYEVSHVISRTENMDAAKDIAILVPNAQLLKDELPDSNAHVTVIVGKNYNSE